MLRERAACRKKARHTPEHGVGFSRKSCKRYDVLKCKHVLLKGKFQRTGQSLYEGVKLVVLTLATHPT